MYLAFYISQDTAEFLCIFLPIVAFVLFYKYFFKIIPAVIRVSQLPSETLKYLKKYFEEKRKTQALLFKQVYEARLKIHQGNPLEGKRDLAMLSDYHGKKRVAKILGEVETWFADA